MYFGLHTCVHSDIVVTSIRHAYILYQYNVHSRLRLSLISLHHDLKVDYLLSPIERLHFRSNATRKCVVRGRLRSIFSSQVWRKRAVYRANFLIAATWELCF